MAEIINLRQVRKAKARAERERDAEANRRLFGRTKSERRLIESESEKAARDLEAHRLDRAHDQPKDAQEPLEQATRKWEPVPGKDDAKSEA